MEVRYGRISDNPPNLPECRPIEQFWALLKTQVYKSNWQAKNLEQLRNRIRYCVSKVPHTVVQALVRSTILKIDYVRKHGVIEKNSY